MTPCPDFPCNILLLHVTYGDYVRFRQHDQINLNIHITTCALFLNNKEIKSRSLIMNFHLIFCQPACRIIESHLKPLSYGIVCFPDSKPQAGKSVEGKSRCNFRIRYNLDRSGAKEFLSSTIHLWKRELIRLIYYNNKFRILPHVENSLLTRKLFFISAAFPAPTHSHLL